MVPITSFFHTSINISVPLPKFLYLLYQYFRYSCESFQFTRTTQIFFFNVYLFLRKRVSGGGAERGGDRGTKASSTMTAASRCGARTHEP